LTRTTVTYGHVSSAADLGLVTGSLSGIAADSRRSTAPNSTVALIAVPSVSYGTTVSPSRVRRSLLTGFVREF
jgi:hypothetical protein